MTTISGSDLSAMANNAANLHHINAITFSQFILHGTTFDFGNLDQTQALNQAQGIVDNLAAQWQSDVAKYGDAGALAAAMGYASPGSKQEQAQAADKLQALREAQGDASATPSFAAKANQLIDDMLGGYNKSSGVIQKTKDFFSQFLDQPILIPLAIAGTVLLIFSVWAIMRQAQPLVKQGVGL